MAGSDTVRSLERGLKILEMAGAAEDGVTLPQVSVALGIKAATAHNLARTLVAAGWLARRASPVRYVVGPAFRGMEKSLGRHEWLERAEKMVALLAARLPMATVVLSEWHSDGVAVSLRVHPSHPGFIERGAKTSLSPYCSASTLCFQAFAPAADVKLYRERYPFVEADHRAWKSEEELDAALKKAKMDGVLALADERIFRAAVPVYGKNGGLVAILGASTDASNIKSASARKNFLKALEQTVIKTHQ